MSVKPFFFFCCWEDRSLKCFVKEDWCLFQLLWVAGLVWMQGVLCWLANSLVSWARLPWVGTALLRFFQHRTICFLVFTGILRALEMLVRLTLCSCSGDLLLACLRGWTPAYDPIVGVARGLRRVRDFCGSFVFHLLSSGFALGPWLYFFRAGDHFHLCMFLLSVLRDTPC